MNREPNMNDVIETVLIKLESTDTVICAVSGGPDSMALLSLLSRARNEIPFQLVCAHVNHNVRLESESEKEFVKSFCFEKHIIFEYMKIEHYGEDNFHNEARMKRYQFFDELAAKYHAKYVMTAHHGDDLLETILMRIVRGSTLHGYAGFSKYVCKENYTIVRPLISVTREDIMCYLKANQIPYVVDSSNEKDVYTRNRYRKYIVPELKREEKQVSKRFYKFSKTLLEYHDFVSKIITDKKQAIINNHKMNLSLFLKEEPLIQKQLLYILLEEVYQDDLMLITEKHVDCMLNLLLSDKPNQMIYLPQNLKFVKSYQEASIVKDTDSETYYLELQDIVTLPNQMCIEKIVDTSENGNDICRLSKDDICFPLYVRTRKDGDRISLKGMAGHKKVNDIFIDNKVPMEKRDTWPIVVDSLDNIVWLPGLKKTQFDRTKEGKYDIILKYYLKKEGFDE